VAGITPAERRLRSVANTVASRPTRGSFNNARAVSLWWSFARPLRRGAEQTRAVSPQSGSTLEGTLTSVDLNSLTINRRQNARTRRRQRVSLQLTSARSTPVAAPTPRALLFCPPGTGGRQQKKGASRLATRPL
jgi:hypothetical protein